MHFEYYLIQCVPVRIIDQDFLMCVSWLDCVGLVEDKDLQLLFHPEACSPPDFHGQWLWFCVVCNVSSLRRRSCLLPLWKQRELLQDTRKEHRVRLLFESRLYGWDFTGLRPLPSHLSLIFYVIMSFHLRLFFWAHLFLLALHCTAHSPGLIPSTVLKSNISQRALVRLVEEWT